MAPHDNWFSNDLDQPGFQWSYCEMLSQIYDIPELHEDSEVPTNDFGTDGWDMDIETEDSDSESEDAEVYANRPFFNVADIYEEEEDEAVVAAEYSDMLSRFTAPEFHEDSVQGLSPSNPIDLTE